MMSALRIMHVVHTLRTGGMERNVLALANALEGPHFHTAICSCTPAGPIKEQRSPGVELFELRKRDGNDPALIARLVRLFRRQRPDIVHTHAWGALVEGLLAARVAGVPVVVHGEHGTLRTRRHQIVVQRWAWRRVDRLLSVSDALAERMAREVGVPRSQIVTIPNGVDATRFRSRDRARVRAERSIPLDAVVIGTIGRLVAVKDHSTLLRALAIAAREGRMVHTLIAGDGALHSDLASEARALGLSESVHFLEDRDDVEDVLAAMDVFVLSSTSEGLSNTILEAMAAGLPVVATKVGGNAELVVDTVTGFLVSAQDPSTLWAPLARLIESPALRRSLGAAGRHRVMAEFSFDATVNAYRALYENVVGTNHTTAS